MWRLSTTRMEVARYVGTHRVQRVPEGDTRRHTSTVTVAVLDAARPAVGVDPADVELVPYRGTGPGGQHRNTADSCVRATHRPTGIVVHATESRSQWVNRQAALAEVARRVAAREQAEVEARAADTRTAQIGDGGRGGFDWNWCAWRDEVRGPGGRRLRMAAALKGRLD